MTQLEIITNNIEKITDRRGLGIDPKIKKAVIAFNYAEFETSQSCEGHLNKWGTPYPWIEVDDTSSIHHMNDLLNTFYLNRTKGEHHLRTVVSAYYYRVQSDDVIAYPELVPLYDRNPERLIICQQEMDEFSEFIIQIKGHNNLNEILF